ncbi:MAG: SOS response-associated peptidase, partial [Pseudomonadota bacterium]
HRRDERLLAFAGLWETWLIPAWVKDPAAFTTLINARSETIFEKPSFRGAIKYRRCLVPADGFYEWTGKRGQKTPHFIHRRDERLLAFAGLWETWLGADGSEIDSMAILTTEANGVMTTIHDRMPVILGEEDYSTWLGEGTDDASEVDKRNALTQLMQPAPDDLLVISPVTWSLAHTGRGKKKPETPTSVADTAAAEPSQKSLF